MPPQGLDSRVESLEKGLTRLEQLPARIDDLTSQVSQLRTEMRDEFSAVRTEMAAGFAEVRSGMTAEFASVRSEIAVKTDRLEARTDGLATQMRVLHEDVIARIALLQEGLSRAGRRKPKKK